MAKCDICGKGVTFGIKVSHSHRRSNRAWKPNVRSVKAVVGGNTKTVNVCTRCLRSGKVERAVWLLYRIYTESISKSTIQRILFFRYFAVLSSYFRTLFFFTGKFLLKQNIRRGGRVVEGAALEMLWWFIAIREFESLPLLQIPTAMRLVGFYFFRKQHLFFYFVGINR